MGAAKKIEKEITDYLEQLNAHQKRVVLSVVKSFARDEENWWEDVESAAADSIDKGLRQAKDGAVIAHDDVMKRYQKWVSK